MVYLLFRRFNPLLEVDQSLCQITNLSYLVLGFSQLVGLPACLVYLPDLVKLDIHSAAFTSKDLEILCGINQLQVLQVLI